MGVAVLPPQDFLQKQHYHHHQIHHKPRRNPNPSNPSNPNNPNPNFNRSNNRRRRNSNSPPPPSSNGPRPRSRSNSPPAVLPLPLPTPQIRILKRGEDLSPPQPQQPTKPIGFGPVMGPLPDGFYAGSAFATSPPPESLPLPAFFTGRRNCGLVVTEAHNQEIACELRRVLKLN